MVIFMIMNMTIMMTTVICASGMLDEVDDDDDVHECDNDEDDNDDDNDDDDNDDDNDDDDDDMCQQGWGMSLGTTRLVGDDLGTAGGDHDEDEEKDNDDDGNDIVMSLFMTDNNDNAEDKL